MKRKVYNLEDKYNYYLKKNPIKAMDISREIYDLGKKKKFGKVYYIKDSSLGNKDNKKYRTVICGKSRINNGPKTIVYPLYKNKNCITFSNFDGNRSINLNRPVEINSNLLVSRYGFKNRKNDYLTKSEKRQFLNKHLNKYKK
ncbi:MAG: hypothetical protein WCR97_03885 [Bacilli bacterium]